MIINRLISILQVVILIPIAVLQYLSDKKMGVMRYLVFKKSVMSKDLFTPSTMALYDAVLILGVILSVILLIYFLKRTTNKSAVKNLFEILALNIIGIVYVFSGKFEELLTYHFFLIAIFVIVSMTYLKAMICLWKARTKYDRT